MKILSAFRRYVSFACSLVALLGLATPAFATHLRGGTVTWRVTSSTIANYTVEFTLIESSRWSYPGNAGTCGTASQTAGTCPALNSSASLTNLTGSSFTFGDGSTNANPTGTVTSINQAEDYLSATFVFSHTYAIAAQPETAFFEAGNRISSLKIGHDEPEYITTIVRNYTNGAPTAATPAILAVPLQPTTATFNIASVVTDIDPNATLVYRLATLAEQYGPGTTSEPCLSPSKVSYPNPGPPGFTVSSTGQVTWDTTQIATSVTGGNCDFGAPAAGDLWTAQIMVEAHDKTSGTLITETPIDFLMKFVTSVGALPTVTLNPAGTQTVAIGTPVAFTATAASINAGAKVTLNASGIPSGATATGLNAAVTPPTTSNFNWTPGSGQDGTYVVTYTVTDDNLQQATASNTIVVATLPTISCSTQQNVIFGQIVTLTSTVFDINQDLLNVVWTVDGTNVQTNSNVTAYPNPATVSLQRTFGNAGMHPVKVTATDPHGVAVSCNTSVTVAKASTSLSALNAPSVALVGTSLTVSTTLSRVSAPAGTVAGAPIDFNFMLSGVTVATVSATTDSSGSVSTNFTPTTSGVYTISASFAGNAGLQVAGPSTALTTVYQRTSLALSPASGNAGSTLTLSASLTAVPGGVPVANQTVTFNFSGTGAPSPVTAVTNANGVATASVVFPTAGSFTATATFSNPGGFFTDSTGDLPPLATTVSAGVTVSLATTSLSALSAPSAALVGNSLTMSATLSQTSAPAGPVAGASVTFTFTAPGGGVTTVGGTTDANGLASANFTPTTGGVYNISAQFAGTGALASATPSSASVTVYQRTSLALSPATGSAGSTLTLNATLTTFPGGVPLANQTVNFSFSGTGAPSPVTAMTNANGVATASVVFPTAGTFTATASFFNPGGFFTDVFGDVPPVADTATAQVTVSLAATGLPILNAPPAALVGGAMTVSATLFRVSAPVGPVAGASVTFAFQAPGGAVTHVSGTTDVNGLASATFTPTVSGVHTISAEFPGTPGLASTLSAVNASVTVYQRTSLALSPASGNAGSTLTLNATLTTVPGGVPVANQTVTFSFAGTGAPNPVTAVTNGNGVATVSVLFPTAGTFTATATFFNPGALFTDAAGDLPPAADTAVATVTVAPAAQATITATTSGLVYSRVTQTYVGTVTLKNTGTSSVSGPFQILFTGLTTNVTLVNATGTLSGTPYITVSAPASLAPGQSVVVTVQFGNPSNATIHFTPVVSHQ